VLQVACLEKRKVVSSSQPVSCIKNVCKPLQQVVERDEGINSLSDSLPLPRSASKVHV
jgi:hypothetical protein